jgi:hypothetical protein
MKIDPALPEKEPLLPPEALMRASTDVGDVVVPVKESA